MPSFNSGKHIEESVESVLAQDLENWELIIVDGGSSDNTLALILKKIKTSKKIKLVKSKKDYGPAHARSVGVEKSKGKYIAFLDADDLWMRKKLELQISFMEANNYSFVYSYYQIIDEEGNYLSNCKAPSSVNAKLMRFSNFIPCLTAVYDSYSIGKISQPNILKRNDFALWLKILNMKDVENAYCLPQITARYRSNSYGLSSNKIDALKYFYLCLKKFGNCNFLQAYFFSIIYLLIVLFKKRFNFIYNLLIVKL